MFKKIKDIFTKNSKKVRRAPFHKLLHSLIRDCYPKDKSDTFLPKRFRDRLKAEISDGLQSLYNINSKMPKEKKQVELRKITNMLLILLKYSPKSKNNKINLEKV
tara:strand:+ start:17684 stop:17998 length:315 start_codon:yes stop_codon:yes gene_type:complete